MMLKIKKYFSILLGCACLVSTSNAMDDNIAMQHTMLNIIQMMENTNDPALNNTSSIAGIPIKSISDFFKIDDYKNSPKGNARKFLNDIIAGLVNCIYENDVNVNGLANNEHYKNLKSIFTKIKEINYNNLTNTKNTMFDMLSRFKSIFFDICKIVKNENNQDYNFIKNTYTNENDYRDLQLRLGRIFLRKTLNNIEWNSNEMLLHKSLLLVLYCEKLIMDLSLFPKDLPSTDNIIKGYWNMIFGSFDLNASSYFK